MQDDPDTRTTMGTGSSWSPGMIAAIVAAVLIVGALFMWSPGDGDRTAGTSSPGTTTGQSSTRPAPPPAAPAPGAAR